MKELLNLLLDISKSPGGEIIIRVICIFFVGALGMKIFFKVFADLFELFTTPKKAKIIEAISDVLGVLGCISASILTSIIYSGQKTSLWVIGEGILYGFGALGLYYFYSSGKLKATVQAIKKFRLKK